MREGETSILNLLRPDDQVLDESFSEADLRLDAVISYLKSWIRAIEARQAYIAPPRMWSFEKTGGRRDGRVGGKLSIATNYFPQMAPSKVEEMDMDDGFKSVSRPTITSEDALVFDPSIIMPDARSTSSSQGFPKPTEGVMAELYRSHRNQFHRIKLSSIKSGRDECFYVTQSGASLLDKLDRKGLAVWFPQSTHVIKRKREFAEMLRNSPGRHHAPLKRILERDHIWPESPEAEIAEEEWIDLTKPEQPGTSEQRAFVRKALGTNDFALVWGPAGAGKTTAICEFIKQAVKRGRKILMVGSTHVAVDNVLEKFASPSSVKSSDSGDEVIAVRVGQADKVAKCCAPLLIGSFIAREAKRIATHLENQIRENGEGAAAASLMYAALKKDLGDNFMGNLDFDSMDGPPISLPPGQGALFRLIMDSANLVGGTSIGILAHPAVQMARDSRSYPEFDYLIIDEASKMTLDEFLVPAMCAKRWIVVGDPYQLAPFCEEAEIGSALLMALSGSYSRDGIEVEGTIVRKLIRNAVELALQERSVRLKGGDFHKSLDMRRTQAIEALAEYETTIPNLDNQRINLRDYCERTLGIALPSILEALIGESAEEAVVKMLPAPRSIVRPFREGLSSRLVELKYQFRMDSRIADFCKTHVYSDRLLLTHPSLPEKSRLHSQSAGAYGRFVVLSTDEQLDAVGYVNRERESAQQLALAVWEILQFADWARTQPSKPDPWKAYLISTYKNQNNLARRVVEYLEEHHSSRVSAIHLEANTVDSCQGHEADLVLLSLVRDRQTPFMRSMNRMNVALTRARCRLVLLGDLPEKTEESLASGVNQTLIDELHDYGLSREVAKGMDDAISIVRSALK